MTKKAYIHIGSHKTGSSSIQNILATKKDLLANHGLSCFDQPIDNENNHYKFQGTVSSWFSIFNTSISDGAQIKHKNILAKQMAQSDGDVIISSEFFSWIFNKHELILFKEELDKYFDNVVIIVYIRRQDAQAISHHQEGSKYLYSPANHFYGNDPIALPLHQEHFPLYLDYNQKLSMWADVFSKENIIVKSFENLYQGDSVLDFFSIFNIDTLSTAQLNTSKGFEQTKIGFLMNQLAIPKKHHVRRVIENIPDSSAKLMPSRQAAKEFYNYYRQSNYELNKKFHINENEFIFNEDFSNYEESSNELWDENSANKAIKNILHAVTGTYGSIDINTLVNAAMKLESIDLKLSISLLNIANDLMPKNRFIIEKLNQLINK